MSVQTFNLNDLGNVATNTTDIATNATNISTNTTDITTNATNISANATDIATNATSISTNTSDIASNATTINTNTTDITTNATNISANATDIATNTTNISTNTTDIATINSTGVFQSNNELVVPSFNGVYIQGKNTSTLASSGVNTFVINETSVANSTNTYTISAALVGGESFAYKAVVSCIPSPQSTTLTDTEVFMFDLYTILHCNSSVAGGDATDDGFQIQSVVRTIGGDTGITATNGRVAFDQSTLSVENTTTSDYDVRVEFTVLQGRHKIAI